MRYLTVCGLVSVAGSLVWLAAVSDREPVFAGRRIPAPAPQTLDPAAWGRDHVGRQLPEFMTGDECLFCHRMDVGPTWTRNRHYQTMRRAEPEAAAVAALRTLPSTKAAAEQVEFVLGSRRQVRFLKRGRKYGHLSLLSTAASPTRQSGKFRLLHGEHPQWDSETFGKSCAGCHASGLDSQTGAVAAVSLDCFTCHGEITLEHTRDSSKALLAKRRRDPSRVVVSICGQCHLRTGTSRSNGRRFANNFVAGDNLFRDLRIDWSDKHLDSLEPGDRHILQNIRDVALLGRAQINCLSCHDVHKQSSTKHRKLTAAAICGNCHRPDGGRTVVNRRKQHNRVCEY